MSRIAISFSALLPGMIALTLVSGCSAPKSPLCYVLPQKTQMVYSYSREWDSAGQKRITQGMYTFLVAEVAEGGEFTVYYEEQLKETWGSALDFGKLVLRPDGEIVSAARTRDRYMIRQFFPLTPQGGDSEDRLCEDEERNAVYRVSPARFSGFPRRLTFTVETTIEHLPDNTFQSTASVTWARKADVAERVETNAKTFPDRSVAVLQSIRRTSRKDYYQKISDIESFLQARLAYEENLKSHQASRPTYYDDATLSRWRRAYAALIVPLQDAWKTVRAEGVRRELETLIDSHDRLATHYVDRQVEVIKMTGQPAPDWELDDLEGNRHHLNTYRGKVVLLDFWAHWCPPCRKALPAMKLLNQHFKDRPFALVGMNTDRQEDIDKALTLVKEMEIDYTVLKASSVQEAYHVESIPAFVVIDAEGIVRYNRSGFDDETADKLIRIIEESFP